VGETRFAVIMAGGPGKRFWPLSTSRCPKPFLALGSGGTLLQECYRRLRALLPAEHIFVIAAAAHDALVAAQLPELPAANRVGEAEGRDSAACIALGTALVAARCPAGSMAALPADQIIAPAESFARTLECLFDAVAARQCVGTIGIPPTEPAVRFGYVELGAAAGTFRGMEVARVARFKEKPSEDAAREYVRSGRFLWNAGIFVAPVAVMAAAMRRHCAPLGAALDEFERLLAAGVGPTEVTRRCYGALPKISIDYAVAEKLEEVITVRAPFAWDDVGDWRALGRHRERDADGNVVVGRHAGVATRNTIVYAPDLDVATLGVEDLVIAQKGKTLLVARADRLDELKSLVDKAGRQGWEDV
jgi:mannose-1-phosphate guanylyltransferase